MVPKANEPESYNTLPMSNVINTKPSSKQSPATEQQTAPTSTLSSLLLLKVQGMSPAANSCSNWKIPYVQDLITSDTKTTPFLALTLTWLKPHIEDSQVAIPGYNILRSDRATRKGGGTALYLQEDLVVTKSEAFDDNYCEVVTCSIDSIKTVLSCLYRPPDASDLSFFNDNCTGLSCLQATF